MSSQPSSSRIIVAYDRPSPESSGGAGAKGGWAELRIGAVSVPTGINPDPAAAHAFFWQRFPHITIVRHFERPIVLAAVKLATFEGFRRGCDPTGVLGVAEGELLADPRFEAEPVAVKFVPHLGEFVRLDTGRVVTACPLLLLTPRGAYGHFPPPTPTLADHLQNFEPQGA
jgi:hypothetical protein